jgi:hypothetical protein
MNVSTGFFLSVNSSPTSKTICSTSVSKPHLAYRGQPFGVASTIACTFELLADSGQQAYTVMELVDI